MHRRHLSASTVYFKRDVYLWFSPYRVNFHVMHYNSIFIKVRCCITIVFCPTVKYISCICRIFGRHDSATCTKRLAFFYNLVVNPAFCISVVFIESNTHKIVLAVDVIYDFLVTACVNFILFIEVLTLFFNTCRNPFLQFNYLKAVIVSYADICSQPRRSF